MMYAQKIKMRNDCADSNELTDIVSICIEGYNGKNFYKKEVLHEHLKKHPNSIRVKLEDQPYLIPAVSPSGEKYVKSTPNDSTLDNLLKLPKI